MRDSRNPSLDEEKSLDNKRPILAKKIVDSYVVCRKNNAKQCQQIMADLPLERTGPAAQFEFTTMDLFGPYEVKDEVEKRAMGDSLLLHGFSSHTH